MTDITRHLVLCGSAQGAVKSKCFRYVPVTKLMRHFPEALRLVEMLTDEPVSRSFSATKGALGGSPLDKAVLSSAGEHDILTYVEAAAARTTNTT